MITASEILEAVQKGGLDSWRPPSEVKYNRYQHKHLTITETKDQELLDYMGDKTWSVYQLSKELNIRSQTCRDALNRAILKGKVKRTVNSQPYKYWVVNND